MSQQLSVGDDSLGSWLNLSFEDEHPDDNSSFLHLSDRYVMVKGTHAQGCVLCMFVISQQENYHVEQEVGSSWCCVRCLLKRGPKSPKCS